MKKSFKTSKFYPCYPIFIVAYLNSDKQPMISTFSSSYSLGNYFILGVGKNSSFCEYIKGNSDFSVNFLDREHMKSIETAGLLSNTQSIDKTHKSGLSFTSGISINAPYINEASLIFECKAETNISNINQNYMNVIASIENRICDEDLLIDGIFQYAQLDMPLYEGDTHQRVYRFMPDESCTMGSYFKEN